MIDKFDGEDRNQVTKKMLATSVSKLDFEDMELSQAIQFLRDISGACIHVKWRVLAIEGVLPETPINLHMHNVMFAHVLQLVLDDAASQSESCVGLDYIIEDGVISISSIEEFSRYTIVRFYDIHAILEQSHTKPAQEIASDLIELITGIVDRDSWEIAGGEAGSIREFNDQLIIRQTYHNHELIQVLLSRLERETVHANIDSVESASPKHELRDSLLGFISDYPEPRQVAFVMMEFAGTAESKAIFEAVQLTLKTHGISGVRADTKEYHPDLHQNVETYMHGAGLGVAVFDTFRSEGPNPNVCLETGYMIALNKPVCLLKDKRLRGLQTDLAGKLYREFDADGLDETIDKVLGEWLQDKGYERLDDACDKNKYLILQYLKFHAVTTKAELWEAVSSQYDYSTDGYAQAMRELIAEGIIEAQDGLPKDSCVTLLIDLEEQD